MKPSSTPPKDNSATKSSKSATSSRATKSAPSTAVGLDTPIQFIKGVGPRLGSLLESRGMGRVRDLLFFFPRTYEDRTKIAKVNELREGEKGTVTVTVLGTSKIPLRTRRQGMLMVRTQDETGILSLKWFNFYPDMERRFKPGMQIRVSGTPKLFKGQPEILHPEISTLSSESSSPGMSAPVTPPGVIPVYVEVEGIPSRSLRTILGHALEKFLPQIPEDLPLYLRQARKLPPIGESIRMIHFPDPKPELIPQLKAFATPWQTRLIYEEFLKFEYLVLRRRLHRRRDPSQPLDATQAAADLTSLSAKLPFQLTGDQSRAIQEAFEEMSKPFPMNRLIQGDVGSGKTAVAFLCAGVAIRQRMQCALMAPTEILAEQHLRNAIKYFGPDLRVEMLTGSTPQSERTRILTLLAEGVPLLLVGTHAIIEDPVIFKNLGVVFIDEQHRFGVEQRRKLRNKGMRPNPEGPDAPLLQPHFIILTATPIPRTLALSAYGDLTVSSIKEMPPGRQPIETRLVHPTQRKKTEDWIRGQLTQGRQAYFIFPLVNESEAEGFENLRDAVSEAERLQNEVYPEFKVGLLHGQLKSDEKAAIMDRFKRGEVHILVSTTVVEVGVDVANANVMVVENAERFGLSQLHQLRGRVGRGREKSFCFLMVGYATGETSQARLEIMEKTTDGFKIAEADLEIRGPGEFLGTRQAGVLPFKMANLVRDQEWLFSARDDAIVILKEDPELLQERHTCLKRYFEREGALQAELFRTS